MVHKLELDNQLKRFGYPSSGVKAWPVGGHGARSRACVGGKKLTQELIFEVE